MPGRVDFAAEAVHTAAANTIPPSQYRKLDAFMSPSYPTSATPSSPILGPVSGIFEIMEKPGHFPLFRAWSRP